jgi:putative SOS response-associated peptidase YedK
MCYDIAYLTKRQEKYVQRYSEPGSEVNFLRQWRQLNIPAVYHGSGFDHPLVPVRLGGGEVRKLSWGLIPAWTKSPADAIKISTRTINARLETLTDKPAFREASQKRRCVVLVDGFFEHHHKLNRTFPYHIRLLNDEPMCLAGIWEEWTDRISGLNRSTFSIVTTRANALMARIHNNPKEEEGPRMPVILSPENETVWTDPKQLMSARDFIEQFGKPFEESQLEAFTVPRLRGKEAIGNVEKALMHHYYSELEEQQGSLF